MYDFIKWYQTQRQDSHYDWGDIELPFLSVKDADVFEPVAFRSRKYGPDVHHCAARCYSRSRYSSTS